MPTTSTNANIKRTLNQAKAKFRVDTLYDEISAGANAISANIANELIDEISENYHFFIQTVRLLKDAQRRSGTTIDKVPYGKGYRIRVAGPEVIYDEFGTGTEGANSPHPKKGDYDLEPYNSGFYIQTDRNGNKYWRYYSDSRGRYVTSHGVPAGMFVYKSFMHVADDIGKNIDTKPIRDAIKRQMRK